MDRYIHYGCGLAAPESWENFDASPTLRLQKIPLIGKLVKKVAFPANVKYGNIVAGIKSVSPNSCKGIYCSHVLEHLSLKDMRTAVSNTFILLQGGGIFRCVLPDLEHSIEIYIKEREAVPSLASINFMNNTTLGIEESPKGFRQKLIGLFGNSHHLWMWDKYSLKEELLAAGFKTVRECTFNDSKDDRFKDVENSGRFYGAIAFECTK